MRRARAGFASPLHLPNLAPCLAHSGPQLNGIHCPHDQAIRAPCPVTGSRPDHSGTLDSNPHNIPISALP